MKNGQGSEGGSCAFAMNWRLRTLLYWVLCPVPPASCTFLLSCLVLELQNGMHRTAKFKRGGGAKLLVVCLYFTPPCVSQARAHTFFFRRWKTLWNKNKQTKPNQTIEESFKKKKKIKDTQSKRGEWTIAYFPGQNARSVPLSTRQYTRTHSSWERWKNNPSTRSAGGWTCSRGFKMCCDGCYTHEHTHTHLPLSLIALLFVCVLLPLFGTPYQKCHFRSCCSSSSSSLSSYGKSSYLSFLVLPSLLPSLFVLSVAPNCGYIAHGQHLFKSCICH